MKTPQQYVNEVLGKAFDEDGVYGCQCVDAFKHFCRTQLGFDISKKSICNPTGYATSIWDNYESLGLNKYFDKVRGDSMVDGDWAIWGMKSLSCPTSHVAMFRKDNNNNIGIFLGQNQLGHPEFTQIGINYNGIRGGLRPKIYHQTPVTPNVQRDETKDQIEVKVDKLRVRTSPSTSGETIGYATKGFYNYYEIKEADNYKWYRIADNQWIAYSDEWENVYPKKEEKVVKLKVLDEKDGYALIDLGKIWVKE